MERIPLYAFVSVNSKLEITMHLWPLEVAV